VDYNQSFSAMVNTKTWRFLVIAIISFSTICNASSCKPNAQSSCDDDVPYERAHFVELLTHNRNHFGNSPGSGQQPLAILADLVNDTSFEQLSCIGFSPLLNLLSATIEIKRPDGFGGGLCTNGSWEYVRFWVDYGSGWDGIGYVSVNTHNIANSIDCAKALTKPLFYTLSIKFEPTHQLCSIPVLPKIRATLSWNELPPDDPYWSPVYGNIVEDHIQSLAKSTAPPTVYTSGVDLPPTINDDDTFLEPPGTCHEIEEGSVPMLPSEDVRPGDPLVQTTAWEQLTCLGLDWSLGTLVATVRVKRPEGYNAPPCNDTAFEYVSFWADWNNTCKWTFLGTTKFYVHDFNKAFPPGGLVYTAVMPVDVSNFSAPCNQTKIGRVRAALSYNSLPPTPPAHAPRGNFLQTHVHLQPYTGVPPNPNQPHIRTIGNVFVQQIETLPTGTGMTISQAQVIGGGFAAFADAWPPHTRECPFGGLIIVTGEPVLGHSYRLMARPYPPPYSAYPGVQVANRIMVADATDPLDPIKHYDPGTDGWFDYLPFLNNYEFTLSYWYPPDGSWQIRLEMGTSSIPHVHEAYTDWYKVFVNNEGPTAETVHIALTGTGGQLCGDLTVGTTVTGTFDAVSPYFGYYGFSLAPGGLNPNPIVVPINIGFPVTPVPPPGSTWSLNTNGATPCGYVVSLGVVDRTVYNSGAGSPLYYVAQVGFCLRKP
jgi:hypothetical protein